MSALKDLWLIKELGDDVALVLCNGKEFSVPLFALPDGFKGTIKWKLTIKD